MCRDRMVIYICFSFCAKFNTCMLPVSRNHLGRRSATADIGDNLLPSLTVLGCSLTAVEIKAGPLSDVILPSFLLPLVMH